MAAHARAGRYRDRPRLHVPYDDAALQYVHSFRGFDVALQFTGRLRPRPRQHLARQLRPGIDGEVPVDAHIAFEASGHAHIARTLDLAFDREIRRNDGIAALGSLSGSRPACRRERRLTPIRQIALRRRARRDG